jgi:hypothetical protein
MLIIVEKDGRYTLVCSHGDGIKNLKAQGFKIYKLGIADHLVPAVVFGDLNPISDLFLANKEQHLI